MSGRNFWTSAGMHLLRVGNGGLLEVTPDYLRAYFARPELRPIETSCPAELKLYDDLILDPLMAVGADRLASLADADAADNYRLVLAFRDALVANGTIEATYLDIARRDQVEFPALFLDQLVHVILRNVLSRADDPMRLRAAELLFRVQNVSTDEGRVLLADEETVELKARPQSGIGALLAATGTPQRRVDLDVLDDDNKALYWGRSDSFDTVVDLRFGRPALDALARVLESWLAHLLGIEARIEPLQRIDDADWRWHVGLDAEATGILNALYEGRGTSLEDNARILALFRMRLAAGAPVIERVAGKPIYLGLAMSTAKRLRMKPQNLLVNLPLRSV
ncbi:MAG: hypothetical protein JNM89_02525 [Hyphomicrobiaceae bacterium]|nr:hypothetical protein [Hyphomicrobiaceae bacterium]